MKLNDEQFQRKKRKSLSQKNNSDEDFISKENKNKRLSQLNQNNKLLSDFYPTVEKSKLQSRSSLPLQFPPDNLSNYNNNTEETNNDKRSSNNSKDLEHSSRDKMSFQNKTKTQFDSFYGAKDIKIVWKNRPVVKEEDKEIDKLENYYKKIEGFMNHLFENKNNENTDTNLSSSTLGPGGSKKSFMKSEDKNTKINLKNIINIIDKNNIKSNNNSVILSDIQHVEEQNNKLDVLIDIMEEYKDIITEKMFCKNLQDRLNLHIFICLSKMSFKLYNCIENKKKFENIRKYICTLTDEIKYNLINNPNFTISLINQKLIDIDRLDKSILLNDGEDLKINDNNPINSISSSHLNLNSRMKKIDFSQNSDSESNKDKIKDNFFNFDDEEIIYENFEEFNIDNGNENDLYVNPNFFCDVDNKDNKDNKVNHIEQSPETNKQDVIENNFMPPLRSPKNKTRRNATHRLVVNKYESKPNNNNNNNNQKRYFNPNNYDFQIIDINGQVDDKELSEDSIDSEAECIEVTENSKSEKQRLVFFEDYLRDKDKRRLTKIDPLQIGPDPTFLENRERLIELNKLSYKNIIDIVKDTTSLLPNYKLNLDPQALANEINEIEKFAMDNKSVNSKDGGKDKIFIYSNDSSNGENNIKESKRFELNDINEEIDNIDNNDENDNGENDNIDKDNNNDKKLNNKSFSSESDKLLDENKRILNLNFLENEDDDD